MYPERLEISQRNHIKNDTVNNTDFLIIFCALKHITMNDKQGKKEKRVLLIFFFQIYYIFYRGGLLTD
jgi:hypothetical protein